MGAPQVDLFAATTGTDSDWVVKLIDVYPNDIPENARKAPRRPCRDSSSRSASRFSAAATSTASPRPRRSTPGKVEEYKFGLPNVDHVFLPGHRIMIQVQSTLFPLYDRNPQTFVPNIFYAKTGDYRAATQSVFYGGNDASAVYLPIVP